MATEQPIINIEGELVALGPLCHELLPDYQRWINDFTALRGLGLVPGAMTMEQETAWYERASASTNDAIFTIYERTTWRPIGTTSLHEINYRNGTATFGIIIGEEECRGKGYGTEATRLMLDYAFIALGLTNVMLSVFEYNLAGQRAYAKAGFREFGRRHKAQMMGGRRWDVIYMECLADGFISPVLDRILVADQPRLQPAMPRD